MRTTSLAEKRVKAIGLMRLGKRKVNLFTSYLDDVHDWEISFQVTEKTVYLGRFGLCILQFLQRSTN